MSLKQLGFSISIPTQKYLLESAVARLFLILKRSLTTSEVNQWYTHQKSIWSPIRYLWRSKLWWTLNQGCYRCWAKAPYKICINKTMIWRAVFRLTTIYQAGCIHLESISRLILRKELVLNYLMMNLMVCSRKPSVRGSQNSKEKSLKIQMHELILERLSLRWI